MGTFDVLIEASAEPSVHAGIADSPRYVLDTNLLGALNCLEFARKRCGGFVFLSTSRVYSIEPLTQLPLVELSTRFELKDECVQYSGRKPRRYFGNLSLQYPTLLLWRVEAGCRITMPGICRPRADCPLSSIAAASSLVLASLEKPIRECSPSGLHVITLDVR